MVLWPVEARTDLDLSFGQGIVASIAQTTGSPSFGVFLPKLYGLPAFPPPPAGGNSWRGWEQLRGLPADVLNSTSPWTLVLYAVMLAGAGISISTR